MSMASRRRNPVLADIFSRLKYMERRGSGFKKIVSAYKGHDGYTEGLDPTFSTPWDSFILTLPKFKVDDVEGVYISSDDISNHGGQANTDTTRTPGRLGENQKRILQLLSSNPLLTIKELADVLGISTTAVENNPARLKQKKKLARIGGDKGGHWEVINKE